MTYRHGDATGDAAGDAAGNAAGDAAGDTVGDVNPVGGDAAPVDLSVDIGGLRLANPVVCASGTFGYGREYREAFAAAGPGLAGVGAVCVKSVTLRPRAGNPPPRLVETPAGLVNSIGLTNPGVDAFVREELPWLRDYGTRVIVSVAGSSEDEYVEVVRRLNGREGIDALELNVSCPNVSGAGAAFGADPDVLRRLTAAARRVTRLPLIVKLTPNVTSPAASARAAAAGGADALSLINTLRAMVIDVDRRRPVLGAVSGGLSGPAVRPVAVRAVWEAAAAVDLPLIGGGGITTAGDALEFILVGARAVSVGTATLVDPLAPLRIVDGIAAYLRREGFHAVADLVGLARRAAREEDRPQKAN